MKRVVRAMVLWLAVATATPMFGDALAWSPGGTNAAWIAQDKVGLVSVTDVDYFGEKKAFARKAVPMELAWAGEQRLAWIEKAPKALVLVLYECSSDTVRVVMRWEGTRALSNLAFDPRDQVVRFVVRTENGLSLLAVALDDKTEVRSTPLPAPLLRFRVSPNGRWVLASSSDGTVLLDTRSPIRTLRVCAAPVRRGDGAISWSADARRLAIVCGGADAGRAVRVYDVDDGIRQVAVVDGVAVGDWGSDGGRLPVLSSEERLGSTVGLFDVAAGKFESMDVASEYVGVAGASAGWLAAIRKEASASHGFVDTRLIIHPPSHLYPLEVVRGVVAAKWSGRKLAFLCRANVWPGRPVTLFGLALGDSLNARFVALDELQEMVRGDIFCRADLHTAAEAVYAELFRERRYADRDVNFGLLARLYVARSHMKPTQNVEPQVRRIFHGLLRDLDIFDEVLAAFREIDARQDAIGLFRRFAQQNRSNTLALKALICAAQLAGELGRIDLVREMVFGEGITIYSELLTAGAPRLKYEPAFIAILAEQVEARAIEVLRAEPNRVDVLTFMHDLLKAFPRATFKNDELTKLHLIIARVHKYRGRLRLALTSYMRALRAAPEHMDKAGIWREVFLAEAQRTKVELVKRPW